MSMPEGTDQQSTEDTTSQEVEAAPAAPAGTGPEAPSENPEWNSFKEKLGPIQYEAVKPLLRENDIRVQQLTQKIHGEYAPLKAFDKFKDVDPTRVEIGIQLADMLDSDPVAFYNMLSQNPRIAASLQEMAAEGGEEDGEDGFEEYQDPRIDQLAEQQAQFEAYVQQQEQQRVDQAADAELESEMTGLKAAHPNYDDEDLKEIVARAAQIATTTGRVPALEAVAQQYDALINRKLQTPRAGSLAPQVMPTNGGVPSANPQQKLGELSSKDTSHLVADLLMKSKAASQ